MEQGCMEKETHGTGVTWKRDTRYRGHMELGTNGGSIEAL